MLPALIYLPLLAPSRFAHPHPTLVFTRATFLYPPILLVLRSSRYRPQCYTDFQIAGFVVVGTLLLQIWFMTAAAICSKLFSVSDDRPSAVSDVPKMPTHRDFQTPASGEVEEVVRVENIPPPCAAVYDLRRGQDDRAPENPSPRKPRPQTKPASKKMRSA